MKRRASAWFVSATLVSLLAAGAAAAADQTVQIPVGQLLNGRSVSTFTDGAVVPWTDGVDQSDGLMTKAAVTALHQSGLALPDDGVFAADSRHPQVVLNFSNTAPATSKQILYLHGTGSFEFAVPSGHYSRLFLFLLSSIGNSPLTVTMTYADGSTTVQMFTLPDWGTGAPLPTNPPIFFNLIEGMHKWDKQDQMVDTPSHTITGVELTPSALQALTKVAIDKPNAGQYLIFWGATGVASDVGMTVADGGAPDAVVNAAIDATAVDAAVDQASAEDAAGAPDGGREAGGPPAGLDAPVDRDRTADAATGVTSTGATGCTLAQTTGPRATSRGTFVLIALAAIAAYRSRRRRQR